MLAPSLDGGNDMTRLFRQRLKAFPARRCTIAARQQHVCQPLMYAMVIVVLSKPLHTLAIAVEVGGTAVLMMQSRECIVAEPHASKSVNCFAAVSRVAAGLPCLTQQTIHDAKHTNASSPNAPPLEPVARLRRLQVSRWRDCRWLTCSSQSVHGGYTDRTPYRQLSLAPLNQTTRTHRTSGCGLYWSSRTSRSLRRCRNSSTGCFHVKHLS